jgi:NADH-quinone oxidoreductase subunit H
MTLPMTPALLAGENPSADFSQDNGWVVLGKAVLVFVFLVVTTLVMIWAERRVVGRMQSRPGPNRTGPFGLLQSLADGVKLALKEDITPRAVDKAVFIIAPIISATTCFLAFAVIPFGPGVTLFGRHVPFQLADLNIGILWVLAMGSLSVYAVVLAGWSSGSNYPLLGSIRSTAQMISYEVGMGLALVAVLMYSGELTMSGIVASQDKVWNVIPQFPAFVIYLIAGLAETNRPPFDLAEAETELVAGFHTEYSGIKFAMFYLGEYVNTVTVAAIATTLFLGGWRGPHPGFLLWLWPILWFLLKVFVIIYAYIWVRATFPRVRYDRLMAFGWKMLIPVGLLWVLATGAVIVLPDVYGRRTILIGGAIFAAILLVLTLIWPLVVPSRKQEVAS